MIIGYLSGEMGGDFLVIPFRQALKDSGYIEGQNAAIEFRFADGQYDRLPALAADLVRRQVNVIVAGVLTLRHAVPAICPYREFAAAGGLMSYGTDFQNLCRLVGTYTGRILKGEKPSELPVQQAVRLG
jgi:ABC-type uncharacterized transport system substrate-binding protein